MHYIHWRKIILFSTLLLLSYSAIAQFRAKDNYNFKEFESKPYYFGISLGINNSTYQVSRSSYFEQNDSIRIVNGILKAGFDLHIITNLKIGQYFDFRFLPGFSFTDRKIEYQSKNDDSPQNIQSFESVFADIPLLLRFKSAPYKDKRLFLVGGIKYQFDVVSNARANKEKAAELLQISPHDFQVEVGAGIQFFFPYFIFSPEFKFSQGIGNVHIYKNDLNESRILENLVSRMFTISFNFEG